MKVLVLGASGLIGWSLLERARSKGWEVAGTYRSHSLPGLIPLNMEDRQALPGLLKQLRPAAIFYCAGWPWVDGCESDSARAYRENAEQPAHAARHAHEIGAHFTYFSTSYVFDGVAGPYDERAQPCPISIYGNSKWEGEKAVTAATEGKAVIARTMGVYGPDPQRKNFVHQVRKALAVGQAMKVPLDQFGNVTYAPDLAGVVLELARDGQSGIWNVAGPDPGVRRSDFARKIAVAYNLPAELIEPVETSLLQQAARRPPQGGLLIGQLQRWGAHEMRDWVPIP